MFILIAKSVYWTLIALLLPTKNNTKVEKLKYIDKREILDQFTIFANILVNKFKLIDIQNETNMRIFKFKICGFIQNLMNNSNIDANKIWY